MKLTPKEARLIEELRRVPTAKITVVTHSGEIKTVRTEIDAEISDKASGMGEIWKKPSTTRTQEVPGPPAFHVERPKTRE